MPGCFHNRAFRGIEFLAVRNDLYFAWGRVRCFVVAGFVRIRCVSMEDSRILTNPASLNTHHSESISVVQHSVDALFGNKTVQAPEWRREVDVALFIGAKAHDRQYLCFAVVITIEAGDRIICLHLAGCFVIVQSP